MSGKDLFEGMSYVDERFVDEAENKTLPKRIVSPWIKVVSMAACLCLIIFSLYNLQPYLRGETEGITGEGASDATPEGEIEDKTDQESQIIAPAEGFAGEVPSVILYVEEMTDLGFIGTVAQSVDTDIFEVGTELNVVISSGARHESTDGTPVMSIESRIDYSGCYVIVQFVEYSPETGTIVVNLIQETDAPESTP